LDETGYCHHRRGCRGLELATTLGRRLDKRGKANVILVDRSSTHIWKPLLHEVATGAMDSSVDQISYRAVARYRHFRFVLGEFSGLDRQNQTITLNAILDEDGNTVLPERELSYDYLVLALGSITNDFGIPGVKDHCYFLDSPEQAQHFQKTFLNTLMRVNSERATNPEAKARIRIVGAAPRALSSRRSWYTRQRRCTSTVSPARTVAWCRSPCWRPAPGCSPPCPSASLGIPCANSRNWTWM